MSRNNGDGVRTWAIDDHGIMLRTISDVARALEEGELVRVLPAYRQPAEVWAVSPVRMAASAKLCVCIGFLQDRLQTGALALREPSNPHVAPAR